MFGLGSSGGVRACSTAASGMSVATVATVLYVGPGSGLEALLFFFLSFHQPP